MSNLILANHSETRSLLASKTARPDPARAAEGPTYVIGEALDNLCTPTRLGTVTRRGGMLCVTTGYDAAQVEGFCAGLDDCCDDPPYPSNDPRHGAWLVGRSESCSALIAREIEHLAEIEQHIREMDAVCAGHPWL